MIQISDMAARKIRSLMAKQGIAEGGLRVGVKGGGCSGLSYTFSWERESRIGDEVFEGPEGSKIFVDKKSKKSSTSLMKVILLENLRNVGAIGDIIDVKKGYAKNFLISQKKALFASKDNINEVEKIKKDLSKKDLEKKKQAKSIQEKVQNKEFQIKKRCNEDKELYGSVTPTEIAKILKKHIENEINPSQIQPLKEIKSIGSFKVIINLHSEVEAKLTIKVLTEETRK